MSRRKALVPIWREAALLLADHIREKEPHVSIVIEDHCREASTFLKKKILEASKPGADSYAATKGVWDVTSLMTPTLSFRVQKGSTMHLKEGHTPGKPVEIPYEDTEPIGSDMIGWNLLGRWVNTLLSNFERDVAYIFPDLVVNREGPNVFTFRLNMGAEKYQEPETLPSQVEEPKTNWFKKMMGNLIEKFRTSFRRHRRQRKLHKDLKNFVK